MNLNISKDTGIEEFIKNYWLGLGDTSKIIVDNPFILTPIELEDPTKYFIKTMMNPEFFYFTCKHLFGLTLGPQQLPVLQELWNRPFPMLIGSRGFSKTTLMAILSMLKAVLDQGSKIVVCGAGLRQSKFIWEHCERIWNSSDMLRDLMRSSNMRDQGPVKAVDKLVVNLGESTITCIPIKDGSTVRGLRANMLCIDEFSSINPEIFEVVLSGFTSVSASPIESMKYFGRLKAMKSLGIPIVTNEDPSNTNKSIIAGTPYYQFNHFYAYWKKWKSIIETKGDIHKLEQIFNGEIPAKFNWKDYSIIRVPVELIPEGFMDEKTISKSKVSLHSSAFMMEFSACFSTDSNGFYKRSLIETCTAREKDPVEICDGAKITFNHRMRGNPNLQYIIGVDPASERDNFSIVVIELHNNHRRIVYCWTIRRADFKKRENKQDGDFYQFCARKIRELTKLFPCRRIIMDSQGGGFAVEEALLNTQSLEPGELPILQIVERDVEKPTDNMTGNKILEFAKFSKAEWVNVANNGMKKDFEDKVLLFPDYDAALLSIAQGKDDMAGTTYETSEDCIMEIEELKDELASIIHTQTGIEGRDRWDTPETKLPGGKKGRQRKDRYSALLMCNMAARQIQLALPEPVFHFGGVVVGESMGAKGRLYTSAPDWFGNPTAEMHGIVVSRG